MQLNEYQQRAMVTCMPSCDNFSYMFINGIAEGGEFASKVAKMIRKGKAIVADNLLMPTESVSQAEWNDFMDAAKAELGDRLWQLSGLCKVMGWTLEEVAEENIAKLASRQQRGVIDGSGDNR